MASSKAFTGALAPDAKPLVAMEPGQARRQRRLGNQGGARASALQ